MLLLTTPVSAGYTQNPISVYYCKETGGSLWHCVAEVTNTPWGERVTFLFHSEGQDVPKAMHVSPLMDMKSIWCVPYPLTRRLVLHSQQTRSSFFCEQVILPVHYKWLRSYEDPKAHCTLRLPAAGSGRQGMCIAGAGQMLF